MNDLMTDLSSRLAPRVRAWHACTYSNFALFAFTTFTEYLITHYKPDNSSNFLAIINAIYSKHPLLVPQILKLSSILLWFIYKTRLFRKHKIGHFSSHFRASHSSFVKVYQITRYIPLVFNILQAKV